MEVPYSVKDTYASHFDTQCGSFSNLILLCFLISITKVDKLLFVKYTGSALNEDFI